MNKRNCHYLRILVSKHVNISCIKVKENNIYISVFIITLGPGTQLSGMIDGNLMECMKKIVSSFSVYEQYTVENLI